MIPNVQEISTSHVKTRFAPRKFLCGKVLKWRQNDSLVEILLLLPHCVLQVHDLILQIRDLLLMLANIFQRFFVVLLLREKSVS